MSYKNTDYAIAVADEQDDHGEDLLNDFEVEEEVGPALDLQNIQVDHMQREHDARNAHELEIGHRRQPLFWQQNIEQRPGQYGKKYHRRKNKESGHLYHLAKSCLEAFVVILQGGKRRVCDLLDGPYKQGKHNVLELLGKEVLTGNSGSEKLSNDDNVDVQEHGIQKP